MIKKRWIFLIILLLLASGAVLAQIYSIQSGAYDPGFGRGSFQGRGGSRGGQGYSFQGGMSRGGRGAGGGRGGGRVLPNQQFLDSSNNLLTWPVDPEFKDDTFTFVRIAYDQSGYGIANTGYGNTMGSSYFRGSSGRGGGRGFGMGGGRSAIDWPDSDNNFSFRLHQVTSIDVNPDPIYITLDNPSLFDYPFIYIVEPGAMHIAENQIKILRQYLLNGGFLMIDDFWGTSQWINVHNEMKRVFPEREPELLTLDHPIFHCVFEIKELPQIPAWDIAVNRSTDQLTGITSESGYPPSFYQIKDDKGRMMVIICRDTDLGDGWEREGMSHTFFTEFSEKKAYPMGINIVFYALTH